MRRALIVVAGMVAVWIGYDLTRTGRSDLREFDPHEVGRLETAMWRSYYDHHRLALVSQLSVLLRQQFHLTFWRSVQGAYYAAQSATVFQRGNDRPDYVRALPDLENYYTLIRRFSSTPFDVRTVSERELEWWIIHRQRDHYSPGDLNRALAELQAAVYDQPAADFAEHARLRAEAMRICDAGGDWGKIAELLDRSWVSLYDALRDSKPKSAVGDSGRSAHRDR
jgi:hypothetical protein